MLLLRLKRLLKNFKAYSELFDHVPNSAGNTENVINKHIEVASNIETASVDEN